MRKIRLILSIGLIMALLVACSPAATAVPQKAEEPAAATDGDATFDWKKYSGSTINVLLNEHPWLTGLRDVGVEKFEELTGIKVNIQPFSEDLYWDKMELALRSKEAVADVFFFSMDGTGFAQYKADLIAPLTQFIDDPAMTAPDYDLADFPQGFLDSATYDDGNLYAIPAAFENYILFYNKSLVDQYLDGKLPTTMEELIADANLIKEESNGEVSGAVVRGVRSLGVIDVMVALVANSWGSEPAPLPYNMFFDGNWDKPRANDPRICEGLDDYASLMKAGPINIQSIDWYDAHQLFNQNKAAFYVDASLFGPSLEANGITPDNVGYMPLPVTKQTAESGSITTQWMWGLGIPANSQNQGPAWYFIQWATNQEIEPLIGAHTGGAPRTSSWNNEAYTSNLNPDYIEAVQQSMVSSRSAAMFYEGDAQIAMPIIDAIQAIYGGMDAQTACDNLQKQLVDLKLNPN